MKTIYKLTNTKKDNVTVYGIEAVTRLDDVFTDKKEAAAFIKKCNSHDLSIIHFFDAVQDYLEEE